MLTAFGPFGSVGENPSAQLAGRTGLPHTVLEVSYAAVDAFLDGLSDSFEVMLMMGVAGGRDRITPEFYGRNFSGKTPDVRGEARFGPIDPKGPLLLPTTLWDAVEVANWTLEYPLRASMDAGEYLCNYLTYRALARFPSKKVGFLHVPNVDKLSLDEQSSVLAVILKAIGVG